MSGHLKNGTFKNAAILPPSKEDSANSLESSNGSNGPCKKAADRKSPSPYRSEFYGKVVIVTGATRALGRQIALSFGREGAALTVQGQAMDKLTSTKDALVRAGVDERKVLMIVGHLHEEGTAQSMLDRTAQKFGKIDALVISNDPPDIGPDSSDNFGENIRNLVQLSSMAAKHLALSHGSIVALGAISPSKHNSSFGPWRAIYSAALDGWTGNAALCYGPRGIRVNSIKVGPIRSDFRSRQTNFMENGDEFVGLSNALGRPGTGDEVANVVLFLASSRASFVTGQTISADGGMEL